MAAAHGRIKYLDVEAVQRSKNVGQKSFEYRTLLQCHRHKAPCRRSSGTRDLSAYPAAARGFSQIGNVRKGATLVEPPPAGAGGSLEQRDLPGLRTRACVARSSHVRVSAFHPAGAGCQVAGLLMQKCHFRGINRECGFKDAFEDGGKMRGKVVSI